jgi:hypothetical protein
MRWALDHLQLIIAIAGSVAWWLNQRRLARKGGEEPPKETAFEDPELAERTRRIREEIQRKIEQRARGYASEQPTLPRDQPAAPPPVPIVREVVGRAPEPPPLSRGTAARLETQRNAEILEQQAALVEQLRQAAEMKAAALRRTQFESHLSSSDEVAGVARSALTEDLRNPESLRRAFILREILGPPVALRS